MPKEFVKLISKEGFEFIIDYNAACISNTIKNMLSFDGAFTETQQGEVVLSEISTPVLERVCQYFYYKLQHQNSTFKNVSGGAKLLVHNRYALWDSLSILQTVLTEVSKTYGGSALRKNSSAAATTPQSPRSPHLQVVAVKASDGHGLSSEAPFNAHIRVPNVMASGGSGGGALMERSKLSLKQQQKSRQPNLEAGGGGGGIGNKVINGGGGGGDDDDDDEYFQEDEGDDPNESKWWHKVPLKQLYDAVTVRAVLSEWCTTIETLPSFLRMLASMQYYSSAQWVRYLTIQDRPNMFRAVERTLARTLPDARSAFVGRVLADPAFVQKTSLELTFAFLLTFAHEMHVRGRRIGDEMHSALINSTCMALAAAMCSALVAPAKTPTPPGTRFPFQRMLLELPNNAFEMSTPTRRFAVTQRVSTFVAKAVEISAVYAVAGGVSVGLQQCVNAGRIANGSKKTQVTPINGISRTAGGLGAFGAIAANSRLQAASGLERVLLEYAKVNTTWQVIGLAALFRAITLAVLENPLGLGPKAVVQLSRPGLAGEPTAHVPSPRRIVRRRVRRIRAPTPSAPVYLEGSSGAPALAG